MDVAVASCRALPEPDADADQYLPALARAGVEARVLGWDDPQAPFDQARLVVLRSTWNYVHAYDEFLAWVERMGPRLYNPPAIVRWNAHKSYLVELDAHGIATVPTLIARRGQRLPDATGRGWDHVVVKPAVSAGSFQTRRLTLSRLSSDEATWLERQCAERDMMVQPFVDSVEGYGERSVVVIDGLPTHAIRKSPRFFDGDEAVSTSALPIADDERALAHAALAYAVARAGVEGPLAYARVDMARDANGAPMIMELELIEPSLFFRQHPPAADAWARALARRLEGLQTT